MNLYLENDIQERKKYDVSDAQKEFGFKGDSFDEENNIDRYGQCRDRRVARFGEIR